MFKVGCEQDEKALILTPLAQILENVDRQQHITCMKEETFKMTKRDIEQLYSWPYIFIHPDQSPTACDHKYIQGIHLHDVITVTAMEIEAHSQLRVVPLVTEKKTDKQYEMLIRKR